MEILEAFRLCRRDCGLQHGHLSIRRADMARHSVLYGALQPHEAVRMHALRRVLFAILCQRYRAAPHRRGLCGEVAIIEREQPERLKRLIARYLLFIQYDLRLERVKCDCKVGRGFRIRPLLACPAQPRHVHPTGQTQGFEHPLIPG